MLPCCFRGVKVIAAMLGACGQPDATGEKASDPDCRGVVSQTMHRDDPLDPLDALELALYNSNSHLRGTGNPLVQSSTNEGVAPTEDDNSSDAEYVSDIDGHEELRDSVSLRDAVAETNEDSDSSADSFVLVGGSSD